MNELKLKENPYFDLAETLADWQKYKYPITHFMDRIVELPWVVKLKDAGTHGTDKLHQVVFFEGDIIEEGTDLSGKNLGNVDVGVAVLFQFMYWGLEKINTLEMKIKAIEDTQLNGMKAISFYATFNNLDGIIINDGYYDVENRVVSNG